MKKIEKMDDFFNNRVEIYDKHQLDEIEGMKECYKEIAKHVPICTKKLLDLGCGTGLEFEEIFNITPNIEVTGIDISKSMLEKFKQKYPHNNLILINASYFDIHFGSSQFDTAVSVESLHHFTHKTKLGLYKKIYEALKNGGIYIEADYMVESQLEEDFYFSEIERIRKEQNIPESQFIHYDTPCTIENQMMLLRKAGFCDVKKVWKFKNTVIITSKKQ